MAELFPQATEDIAEVCPVCSQTGSIHWASTEILQTGETRNQNITAGVTNNTLFPKRKNFDFGDEMN